MSSWELVFIARYSCISDTWLKDSMLQYDFRSVWLDYMKQSVLGSYNPSLVYNMMKLPTDDIAMTKSMLYMWNIAIENGYIIFVNAHSTVHKCAEKPSDQRVMPPPPPVQGIQRPQVVRMQSFFVPT